MFVSLHVKLLEMRFLKNFVDHGEFFWRRAMNGSKLWMAGSFVSIFFFFCARIWYAATSN